VSLAAYFCPRPFDPRLFVMAIVEPTFNWSGFTKAEWLLVSSNEENLGFL
jgi:hypothetical protein